MADGKKAKWVSYGYYLFAGLAITGSILGITHAHFNIQLSKLGIQFSEFGIERSDLGSISTAPTNLASAPESFRLALRREAPNISVDEMTQTKAWSDLQEEASAYAQRLEVMNRQMRDLQEHQMRLSRRMSRRFLWTSLLTLPSAIGMALFAFLNRKAERY